jgi:hypothetical protein
MARNAPDQTWQQAVADPDLRLEAGSLRAMQRNWPFSLFLLFAGSLMASNPGGNESPFGPIAIIGAGMCIIGVYLLISRFLHRGRTVVAIDADGLTYDPVKSREPIHLPWAEVIAIERISIVRFVGKWAQVYIRQPCLVVSRDYYDRAIHIDSLWQRGPAWHVMFIRDDAAGVVRVLVPGDWFDWPKRHLFEALALRWQRFGTPDADAIALMARYRAENALDSQDERRHAVMSRPFVRPLFVAAVVSVLVWLWPKVDAVMAPKYSFDFYNFRAPDLAGDLLQDASLPARRADGRMVHVGTREVQGIELINCTRSNVPNPDAFNRASRFRQRATCTLRLALTDGTTATGLLRVDNQINLVSEPTYSFVHTNPVAVSVDLTEAELLICKSMTCR